MKVEFDNDGNFTVTANDNAESFAIDCFVEKYKNNELMILMTSNNSTYELKERGPNERD
jgi:hypothetical protein